MAKMTFYPPETEALMQSHCKQLSEKDCRRYAAVEALKLGYGGKSYTARLLGISRTRLNNGIAELTDPEKLELIPSGKQRKAGGGRKKNLL